MHKRLSFGPSKADIGQRGTYPAVRINRRYVTLSSMSVGDKRTDTSGTFS